LLLLAITYYSSFIFLFRHFSISYFLIYYLYTYFYFYIISLFIYFIAALWLFLNILDEMFHYFLHFSLSFIFILHFYFSIFTLPFYYFLFLLFLFRVYFYFHYFDIFLLRISMIILCALRLCYIIDIALLFHLLLSHIFERHFQLISDYFIRFLPLAIYAYIIIVFQFLPFIFHTIIVMSLYFLIFISIYTYHILPCLNIPPHNSPPQNTSHYCYRWIFFHLHIITSPYLPPPIFSFTLVYTSHLPLQSLNIWAHIYIYFFFFFFSSYYIFHCLILFDDYIFLLSLFIISLHISFFFIDILLRYFSSLHYYCIIFIDITLSLFIYFEILHVVISASHYWFSNISRCFHAILEITLLFFCYLSFLDFIRHYRLYYWWLYFHSSLIAYSSDPSWDIYWASPLRHYPLLISL